MKLKLLLPLILLLASHAYALSIAVFDNYYLLTNIFILPGDQVTFTITGQNILTSPNLKTAKVFFGAQDLGEFDMTAPAAWTVTGSLLFDGTTTLQFTVNGSDNNTNDVPIYIQGVYTNEFTNIVLHLAGTCDVTNQGVLILNSALVNSTEQGVIGVEPTNTVIAHVISAGLTTNTLYQPPQTIMTSTQSTGGLGAGLVTWDTNYLYISVGTNLWEVVPILPFGTLASSFATTNQFITLSNLVAATTNLVNGQGGLTNVVALLTNAVVALPGGNFLARGNIFTVTNSTYAYYFGPYAANPGISFTAWHQGVESSEAAVTPSAIAITCRPNLNDSPEYSVLYMDDTGQVTLSGDNNNDGVWFFGNGTGYIIDGSGLGEHWDGSGDVSFDANVSFLGGTAEIMPDSAGNGGTTLMLQAQDNGQQMYIHVTSSGTITATTSP